MSLTPQFGSLIPSSQQEILNSNYLQFNGGGAAGDTLTLLLNNTYQKFTNKK